MRGYFQAACARVCPRCCRGIVQIIELQTRSSVPHDNVPQTFRPPFSEYFILHAVLVRCSDAIEGGLWGDESEGPVVDSWISGISVRAHTTHRHHNLHVAPVRAYLDHHPCLTPPRAPAALVLLFSLVPVAAWFVVRPLIDPVPPVPALYVSVGFSIFALLATIYLVPALGPTFVKANLKGRDLLKTYNTPMCVLPVDAKP
jgi:hypothetical protein